MKKPVVLGLVIAALVAVIAGGTQRRNLTHDCSTYKKSDIVCDQFHL